MEETLITKTCGQCGVEKELTPEFYGVQTASADGFRSICRVCFSDNRSAQKMRDVKNLKNHDRIVKAAKAALEKPELLPPNQLHKLNQIVNGDEKKRAKLQAKIQEAHKSEEAARIAQTASPSLARVQTIGSALFGSNGELLSVAERPVQLAKFKLALTELTDEPVDALARSFVKDAIHRLEEMVSTDAARETFLAQHEQETANGWATQRAVGQIHDAYLPLIRKAKTISAKNALRMQLWKMKRAAQDVATNSTEKDDTGAQKSIVALAVAKEFDKMARMLYGDTKAMAVSDTLENIQSRIDSANAAQEWLEQAERDRQKYWADLLARDPDQHARESKSLILQTKGTGPLVDMQRDAARKLKRENPEEYTRRALEALKPRKVSQDVIVYRVPTDAGTVWMWPDGREVRQGGDVQHAEIIKDARLGWVLNPSPLGADLDDGPPAKMEGYYDEMDCNDEGYPKWKYRPEGSAGEWAQGLDGGWKRLDNPSPWGKATPIVFKDAEPPASPEHTIFRYGGFWKPEDVEKNENAEWSDTPPPVLPPLTRVVADCVATEPPPTAAQLRKMNAPAETPWQRHERKQRQEKEAEAALLHGKFIWNFESAIKAQE